MQDRELEGLADEMIEAYLPRLPGARQHDVQEDAFAGRVNGRSGHRR